MNRTILLVLLLICVQLSWAHGQAEHNATGNLAISTAFDQTGKLWRVHVKDDFVYVSQSIDQGKTFSKPIKANAQDPQDQQDQQDQQVSAHGEVRPKIAIGKNNEIYVTWVQNLKARFSGYVWFARSIDGGKSFEKPIIVHQDRAEIGHGFEEISVAPNGDVTVLWLDARDLVAAKQSGEKRSGSSIYYAVSTDAGKTFTQEKKLADNSCECCRITTGNKPDGTVVALWRHVFEGSERDHNIAEIPKTGAKPEAHRATFGHWVIDGCPHHGAALASGGDDANWWGYHLAYFDGNDKKPGLYYSRMDGVAWVASPAKKFGDNGNQAGHPSLLSNGENVWLAWREIKDGISNILAMYSDDGGKSWDDARVVESTAGKTDYPFLLRHQYMDYLIWNTQKEGLKVLPLLK